LGCHLFPSFFLVDSSSESVGPACAFGPQWKLRTESLFFGCPLLKFFLLHGLPSQFQFQSQTLGPLFFISRSPPPPMTTLQPLTLGHRLMRYRLCRPSPLGREEPCFGSWTAPKLAQSPRTIFFFFFFFVSDLFSVLKRRSALNMTRFPPLPLLGLLPREYQFFFFSFGFDLAGPGWLPSSVSLIGDPFTPILVLLGGVSCLSPER